MDGEWWTNGTFFGVEVWFGGWGLWNCWVKVAFGWWVGSGQFKIIDVN